jgi:lipoprotein-releasing system permease protein
MNSTRGLPFIRLYAWRLLFGNSEGNQTLKPVVRIATTGIVLGMTAMLLSTMVVTGFRDEITSKVTGFVSNYRIASLSNSESFEEQPISLSVGKLSEVRSIKGIRHIQEFAHKAALLKTGDDISGIVLKGYSRDRDTSFFASRLKSGRLPEYNDSTYSKEVLVSEHIARKTGLKIGDDFLVFFIQNDRKVRKVEVCGIYNSGLGEEFDQLYVFCDLGLIRKINGWANHQCGGYEIRTSLPDDGESLYGTLYQTIGMDMDLKSSRDLYPQMFQWLELQNINVVVIIALITLVAGITLLALLLILVMEHTRSIGILKTMGARDQTIGAVFSMVGLFILLRGIFIGNLIALLIAGIQYQTGIIRLDEESYYLSQVPIRFSWISWSLTNVVVLIAGLLLMKISTRIISSIRPIRALRFD